MKKRIIAVSAVLAAILITGHIALQKIYVVPILMYHSVDTESSESYKLLTVTPKIFKKQMEFLKRNKYNVISLNELADILNSKKRMPKKTICITFDDGYENNYKYAYPVLKSLGLPGAIFIVTNLIDKPGYLAPDELKEMSDSVILIGSHTKSHFWLGAKDEDVNRAQAEVSDSKRILERIITKKVDFFCYPAGGFTKETRQLVIDAGYRGAVATMPGPKYPNDDLYALKRLRIGRQCDNLFVFWFETNGYYTWIKENTHRHRYKDKKI